MKLTAGTYIIEFHSGTKLTLSSTQLSDEFIKQNQQMIDTFTTERTGAISDFNALINFYCHEVKSITFQKGLQ